MTLLHDVRFAIRTLRRSPGYTCAALLTLVLGLGANTAVFSVVHGILLAPLPYAAPDRLVSVWEETGAGHRMDSAWRNFEDWRERSRSLSGLAAYGGGESTVLLDGVPLRAGVAVVSAGFFRVLGVPAEHGRVFLEEEHRLGADAAVVVSDGFWRTRLGGDPDLSSKRIAVGEHIARVVGVMPPGFGLPGTTDVWYPLELDEQTESRTSHNYTVVGRLKPGITAAAAEKELDGITASFLTENPGAASERGFEDYFPRGAGMLPLRDDLVGAARRPLLILLGASVLVLLVACTNLASATLARGAARDREYAVRRSLGAGRGVLLRQLFTESLVLALAGGVLAVTVAAAAIRLLPAIAPAGIPRVADVRLDAPVIGVALLVAVATAVLFGLLPALRVSEGSFAGILRTGVRGGEARGRHRVWKGLIAVEVALALMLLIGSGLLIRSFQTILAVQPGFRTTGLLTMTVDPPASRYGNDDAKRTYYEALLRSLESVPGVAEAGLVSSPPLGGVANGLVDVRGGPQPAVSGGYLLVSEGYFRAAGIPVLRGRVFDDRDREGNRDVVIVNRAFAELAWPGEDAIGKQMTAGGMDNFWNQDRWATVIGVVGNTRQRDLTEPPRPAYYFSLRQRPFRAWSMTALLRPERGSPADLAPAVRDATRQAGPDVAMTLRTIEARVSEALVPRRFTLLVLSAFAGIALLLACVGIWGVVSYAVARRTREIGIRMALGADARSVRRLVQRDYLRAAAIGAVAGLLLSFALTRLMQGLLFEVRPTDPRTFIVVLAVLAAAAWLASFIPSLRGTRVSPLETMRSE